MARAKSCPCRTMINGRWSMPERPGERRSEMQALLILVVLVVLAVAAVRYGVDSRDGADWSPPARSKDDGNSA